MSFHHHSSIHPSISHTLSEYLMDVRSGWVLGKCSACCKTSYIICIKVQFLKIYFFLLCWSHRATAGIYLPSALAIPSLLALKLIFFILTQRPKIWLFSHRNRWWGGSRTYNLPKVGILYLNSVLIHDYTAGQIAFLSENVAAAF